MSSYSFSHQFYQRWTCAPEAIRAAITQELKDITTLLQNDTPFESFVFNTHDLDTHIDELYENHEAEQAIAKAIADKQAQEQAAAEKQRIEEEQKKQTEEESKLEQQAKIKQETQLREGKETAQKQQEKNHHASIVANNLKATITNKIDADSEMVHNTENNVEKNSSGDSTAQNKTISEHANALNDDSIKSDKLIKSDQSIKAINDKASAAISLTLKDVKLNGTHQALIRELEMQIDDYLSDQMMLMSENLKSWLRAEMTQHLGEQDKTLIKSEQQKG